MSKPSEQIGQSAQKPTSNNIVSSGTDTNHIRFKAAKEAVIKNMQRKDVYKTFSKDYNSSKVTKEQIDQLNGRYSDGMEGNELGYIKGDAYLILPNDCVLDSANYDMGTLVAIAELNNKIGQSNKEKGILGAIRANYVAAGLVPKKNETNSIYEVTSSDKTVDDILSAMAKDDIMAHVSNITNTVRVTTVTAVLSAINFYTRGHHCITVDCLAMERIMKSMEVLDELGECEMMNVMHTNLHPIGVARPYVLVEQLASDNRLPEALDIRFNSVACGNAALSVIYYGVQKIKASALSTFQQVIFGRQIETVNATYQKIYNARSSAHVMSRLYGHKERVVMSTDERNAVETLSNFVVAAINVLEEDSTLTKAAYFKKVKDSTQCQEMQKILTNWYKINLKQTDVIKYLAAFVTEENLAAMQSEIDSGKDASGIRKSIMASIKASDKNDELE